MSQEFLPKDPTKALIEIKEKLYHQLNLERELLATFDKDDWDRIFVTNNIDFLQNLLDICERS